MVEKIVEVHGLKWKLKMEDWASEHLRKVAENELIARLNRLPANVAKDAHVEMLDEDRESDGAPYPIYVVQCKATAKAFAGFPEPICGNTATIHAIPG